MIYRENHVKTAKVEMNSKPVKWAIKICVARANCANKRIYCPRARQVEGIKFIYSTLCPRHRMEGGKKERKLVIDYISFIVFRMLRLNISREN